MPSVLSDFARKIYHVKNFTREFIHIQSFKQYVEKVTKQTISLDSSSLTEYDDLKLLSVLKRKIVRNYVNAILKTTGFWE